MQHIAQFTLYQIIKKIANDSDVRSTQAMYVSFLDVLLLPAFQQEFVGPKRHSSRIYYDKSFWVRQSTILLLIPNDHYKMQTKVVLNSTCIKFPLEAFLAQLVSASVS